MLATSSLLKTVSAILASEGSRANARAWDSRSVRIDGITPRDHAISTLRHVGYTVQNNGQYVRVTIE